MKQQMIATIYGAQDVSVEGTRHSKIWIGQQVSDPKAQNAKGIDMMAIKCEPTVYDSLGNSGFPMECAIETELRRGAKNSLTQFCTSVAPAAAAAAPSKAK